VDVERIATTLGLSIERKDVDPSVDGFLLRTRRLDKGVIGVNTHHHINRQRFTVAHELGHFLLHKGDTVHVDQAAPHQIKLRDVNSSSGTDLEEIEANAFAAELLMPEPFLARDLRTRSKREILNNDDLLSELAEKYTVSSRALTLRIVNLRFTPV
jgi:Zn-dependent peptidase ImmA (M78 family)